MTNFSDRLDSPIESAAKLIRSARGVLVAAGAGMGVDSGLPDFRGDQGFWHAYPALGRQGKSFADAATASQFTRDPRTTWGFYGHRLALYRRTQPHAGFGILRSWCDAAVSGGRVFTSNVDGQFQRAGFEAGQITERHGSIHWMQCSLPCDESIWSAAPIVPDVDEEACKWRGGMPTCPSCGGIARPNVLMFNDPAWIPRRTDRQQDRLDEWLEVALLSVVVVEIGAGVAIPSVRSLSERITRRGGNLVRINPQDSRVRSGRVGTAVGLPMRALEALEAIDQALRDRP